MGGMPLPQLPNPSESAPTIAVMPVNRYILRANLRPPLGEFFARDIERRRRDQMVKDYGMVLAPAKAGDRFEIVVIEKMTCQRSTARRTVQGAINQFGSREHDRGGNFGKL